MLVLTILCLEFTEHQRQVFCVFSGQGVIGLRRYLNNERDFAHLHDPIPGEIRHRPSQVVQFQGAPNGHAAGRTDQIVGGNGAFDEGEPDIVDDDDGLDEGSEMAIDTQPLLGNNAAIGLGVVTAAGGPTLGGIPPPPPPPLAPPSNNDGNHPHVVPETPIEGGSMTYLGMATPRVVTHYDDEEGFDAMDISFASAPNGAASTAGGAAHAHNASRNRQASGAGPVPTESGPSTASGVLGSDQSLTPSGASRSPSRSNGNSPAGL